MSSRKQKLQLQLDNKKQKDKRQQTKSQRNPQVLESEHEKDGKKIRRKYNMLVR